MSSVSILKSAMLTWRMAATLLVGITAALGCSRSNPGRPAGSRIAIAAAASVRPAMEAIAESFRRAHPGVTVETTYGASGNFYAQMTSRAPFDLYYSADTHYPHRLAEQGLVLSGTERVYAVGRLVLVVRRDAGVDPAKDGPSVLGSPAIRHIAIANPDLAPYGRAARDALKPLGLGDNVAAKLVLGENIEQAAQFLQSGAAEAAFIPLSLASQPAMKDVGPVWNVPNSAAPPIEHGMAILAWTPNAVVAKEFDAFVAGPEGRRILAEHGFGARE